jgi:hypothetical protein
MRRPSEIKGNCLTISSDMPFGLGNKAPVLFSESPAPLPPVRDFLLGGHVLDNLINPL